MPLKRREQPFGAIAKLHERLADAKSLIEIHETLTGDQPGRRFGVDALNRSVILLSVAAWEGFIEDLVVEAAKRFEDEVSGPSKLPKTARNSMLSHLYDSQNWATFNEKTLDGLWSITGSHWRTTYLNYVEQQANTLNTPNSQNTIRLLKKCLGINDCTAGWIGGKRWKPDIYRKKLDALLELRHRIAHGAVGQKAVRKVTATAAVALVQFLAEKLEETTRVHVGALVRD